jgi:hypothetical protein
MSRSVSRLMHADGKYRRRTGLSCSNVKWIRDATIAPIVLCFEDCYRVRGCETEMSKYWIRTDTLNSSGRLLLLPFRLFMPPFLSSASFSLPRALPPRQFPVFAAESYCMDLAAAGSGLSVDGSFSHLGFTDSHICRGEDLSHSS